MLRNVINFAFAILLFSIWLIALAPTNLFQHSDFAAYYVSAKQFAAHHPADIYSLSKQTEFGRHYFPEGQVLAFEPPYALAAVLPLAWMSSGTALIVVDCLLIIFLALSSLVLARILKVNNHQILWLIGALALSGPAFEIIKASKPIPICLFGFCMSIFYLQKKSEIKAGAFAALCLIKPQEILPFLAFAAGCKHWRFVLSCLTAGVFAILITLPLTGVDAYTAFLSLMAYLNAHPELTGSITMPTLRGQLLRCGVEAPLAVWLTSAIFVVILIGMFLLGRTKINIDRWWIPATIAAFTIAIPFLPYIHLYDLIMVAPAACFLLKELKDQQRMKPIVVTLFCLLLFMQPIYGYLHYYYFLTSTNTVNLHFLAIVVLGVVGLLVVLNSSRESS